MKDNCDRCGILLIGSERETGKPLLCVTCTAALGPCSICGATDHERVPTSLGLIQACPKAPVGRPRMWMSPAMATSPGVRFAERLEREIAEAHAAMDRKEAEFDKFGYGGDPSKSPPRVTGLTSPIATDMLARPALKLTGKFRVYFNRHGAEPLMWCVAPDAGGWELALRDVQIATIAETVYRKKSTADEEDGRPSAWFACEGVLTVSPFGFATIGSP